MKLVSLNTWGATQGQPFFDFIKQQAKDTDVFCFQEIFSSLPGAPKESCGARLFLFEELSSLLPEFAGFFDPRSFQADFSGLADFSASHGMAIFAKRELAVVNYNSRVLEVNDISTMECPVEGWTKAQVLTLQKELDKFSVINFHGVAQPGSKLDTPQRIDHAKKLLSIWDSLGSKNKILCGDFNMYPEIESIKILESCGRNLIKEFNIANTRNEVSWNKYPGSKQTFADFTFVSPEIKVKDFQVPYNEVSDHLPMILNFELKD